MAGQEKFTQRVQTCFFRLKPKLTIPASAINARTYCPPMIRKGNG